MTTGRKEKLNFSTILIYISLVITAIICLLPIFVIFLGAFKTSAEFASSGVLELPKSFFNFENFAIAIKKGKMLAAFGNTIFIILISIVATVLTGTMTAYILNRFKFPGNKLINNLFLVASLIPSITMQISIFQIISGLHLYNTRWATIILFAGTDIISIYIFLQFLENISVSLDESAIVDGASYFTIFSKILFPLLKPAIVTVIIIKGVGFYNEFYTPFLYMPSEKLRVISTSLFKFRGPFSSQWEVICAGIIIVMLPTLIIFLALQKQIYQGMTQGAVKE